MSVVLDDLLSKGDACSFIFGCLKTWIGNKVGESFQKKQIEIAYIYCLEYEKGGMCRWCVRLNSISFKGFCTINDEKIWKHNIYCYFVRLFAADLGL